MNASDIKETVAYVACSAIIYPIGIHYIICMFINKTESSKMIFYYFKYL